MRYRKARSRKEKSAILTEFCRITAITSRKHAIRLLSSRSKPPEGTKGKPGRKGVYDSPLFREELVSIWRELVYPSSLHLSASLKWMVPLKELHGHTFDPNIKELLLSASRSTAERILASMRNQMKGSSRRTRYKHNPMMSEIPLAIDCPRPDEPGHLQVDLVHFSGGDTTGHYIHMVVVVDRCTLWIEASPCMGRSGDAVLTTLREALSRMPCKARTLQTDNGPEFLNDHLRFFCKGEGIEFMRSRPYRKNDNAHVEGGIGNIIRKELGYLRYESPEALDIMNEICQTVLRWTHNFLRATARYNKERVNGKVVRKHDELRPAFVRVCEREEIQPETKEALLRAFRSINPNGLDEVRESLLRRLFSRAVKVGASGETKPSGDTDKPCLVYPSASSSSSSKLTKEVKEHAHI